MRVLIADDNDDFVDILSTFMSMNSIEYVTANNYRDISSHIEKEGKLDVFILDYGIASKDSVELVKLFNEKFRDGDVFVISGLIPGNVHDIFGSVNVTDFIEKPFSLKEFIERIKNN